MEISEKECWMLKNLCAIRCLNLRNKHTYSDDIWDINYIGVLSEYAWSKKWNLHYNLIGHIEKGSSDFKSGTTCYDIKSTRRKTGNLIVNPNEINSDIYVLAIVTNNNVDFVGWKEKGNLYSYKIGDKTFYGCEKEKLNQWPEQ